MAHKTKRRNTKRLNTKRHKTHKRVKRKLRKTYRKRRVYKGGGREDRKNDLSKFTSFEKTDMGKFEDEINKKIDFTSFDNIDDRPISILSNKENKNYDIYKFQYIVDRDKKRYSEVILKVPLTDTLPNIYYEYIVGQYINTLCKQYPCFLQTYTYFKFNEGYPTQKKMSQALYDSVKYLQDPANEFIAGDEGQTGFFIEPKESPIDSVYACKNPLGGGILIQYLPMIQSFLQIEKELIDSIISDDKKRQQTELVKKAFDFLCLFFQIYMPLAQLKDFTHNKLTYDQVVIYVPYNNKKVIYNYKFPGGETVSFISEYMVKIKNYGTCYFNDTKSVSSEMQQNKCKDFVVPTNDPMKDLSFYNDFLTMQNIDKKDKEKTKIYEGIINTLFGAFNKTKGVKTVQMLADHLKNKYKDKVFAEILETNKAAIESKDKGAKGIFGTLEIDMSGANSPMMFSPHFLTS